MKKKRVFTAVLSVFAISSATAALATGCGQIAGKIDAPTNLEEELGAYVIPDYEVVDDNGMVLAGYNVYLKSVKNADGEELAENYGSAVTVDEAGIYSFVYSAGSNKIKDVTVSIDFADRTAPTINCDDSTIPKFFITGNSYKVPQYTLSGDFDRSKCWAKVFHIDEDKKETEVKVDGGRFLVDKTGSYAIRVHVEDSVGNANDYEYVRKVDGPETVVENKVLYLDEQFGEKQISCYQSAYTGGYVSKDEEDAHAYGDEGGAYKVSFNGETATQYNEGLLVMDVPAIIDINEYENLYMYVYNDSEKDIVMGSQWWNDTTVKAGQWTQLTWNTRAWGNNVSANNTKTIGLVDISGMTIRFIFDYGQKVIPNGTFYLSAMYGTPKVKSELTVDENVILNNTKYYINDLAELNAAPIDGKTVDYYKVDGKIIPGNNFIVTGENHNVEVVYKDGELTKDDMTWAQPDEFTLQGDDNQWQTLGVGDYFAYTFDIYGAAEGWCYAGVQVGGNGQLLGFEISNAANSKFSGYGGSWKWMDGVKLTPAQYEAIRSATKENPVKAALVRRGTEIRAYLMYGDNLDFIASVDNSTLQISENQYGYGQRNGPVNVSHNVAVVGGETKTLLYFEKFAATVTPASDKVSAEGEKFYIGDTVTLTSVTPPAGQMLAYFTVNGERITGSQFIVRKAVNTVDAVFTDASTLTLAEGIQTSDGKNGTVQVAKDSYVTLEYVGNAPAGKLCVGFIVDGTEVRDFTIHVSGNAHTIEVLFADSENEKLNDITGIQADGTGLKFDGLGEEGANKWAPAKVEYVTDYTYSGPDGTVDRNSLIKITTQEGENSFALTNGEDDLDAYEEIYFYVYTTASGVKAGGWWCNDTEIKPSEWTKISFDRSFNPTDIVNNGTTSVWEGGLKDFAIRIFNAPADATVYVTAVYGVPFAAVEVSVADDSKNYVQLSAPRNGTDYRQNETVTLTCTNAPAGKAFASFTVGGKDIEGNTYTLTSEGAVFGVRFSDISTVTVSTGVGLKGLTANADGTYTVGQGVKVTLEYTGTLEAGQVFDYFMVDGNRIIGNTFTTNINETGHTVTVQFAEGAANLTWVMAAEAEKTDITYSWSAYTFTGTSVGEGTQWAIETEITSLPGFVGDAWRGFDFLVGANASIQIRIHTSGLFQVHKMGTEHGDGGDVGTYFMDKSAIVEACKNVSSEHPVKFTLVRNGNKYYILFNDILAATTDVDFKTTSNIFGVGKTSTGWLTLYDIETYKYRTGEAIAEYLLSSKVTAINATTDHTNGIYTLGETVVLTAAPAEANKKFAYFEVNDERITGNTFTVTQKTNTVKAVYTDIATLTLADGISTSDGKTGEIEVAKQAVITLEFTGTSPAGKYFNGFVLDGQPLTGNTFTVTGNSHKVTAVFADCVTNDNEKLNDITGIKADGTGLKFDGLGKGGANKWAPAKVEYVTDFTYDGLDDTVDRNSLIKITTQEGENSFALTNGKDNLSAYEEIYFYVYTTASGVKAGGWWCNDTAIKPSEWTKISFDRSFNPKDIINNGTKSVWEGGLKDFAIRIFNAPAGATIYVTAVYGVPYEVVEVSVADDSKNYVQLSAPRNGKNYVEEEVVILTLKGAVPAGKAFASFTVGGKDIEGKTYTLTSAGAVFGVRFSDISTVTVSTGVGLKGLTANSDGTYTVGQGVKVTLEYTGTPESGKFFDCFKVNGEKIVGDSFVTDGVAFNAEAVFASNADEMTWFTQDYQAPEETNSGGSYKTLGNDSSWVLKYDVTATNKKTVNSGIPNAWYAGVLFSEGQIIGYQMGENNDYANKIGMAGTTWDNMTDNGSLANSAAILNSASKTNPVTLIFIRKGNKFSTYFECNGTIYAAVVNGTHSEFTDKASIFGYGWRVGGDIGGNPDIENIEWVTGETKTNAYLDSLKVTIDKVNVTTDKDEYILGETVVLTAAPAEENKKFAYFEVNDKRITGNTFTVTQKTNTVKAVYTDISTLTLDDGISTSDGETGTVVVALNNPVYLTVTDNTKYYVAFSVDGTPIEGNSFTPTESKTYRITVQLADRVANDNSRVNDISKSGMHSGVATLNYVKENVYNGDDGAITESGSLKITEIGGNDIAVKSTSAVGELDLASFKEVYFYIWANTEGAKAATWWCNDTAITAKQWTKITVYKDENKNLNAGTNPYDADGVGGKLFAEGSKGDNFIYRIMNGTGKTIYMTSLYAVPYADVEVSVDQSVASYIGYEGTCKEGQTITLTCNGAPAGKAFSYFTVNNVKIEGNTYKLGTKAVVIGAQFAEVSVITLGTGVKVDGKQAENGKVTVGRGATVTLVFDGAVPDGQYFKGFKVDNKEIEGNIFSADGLSHEVEAVFANCIQTGAEQLNEVSKVLSAEDYVKAHDMTSAEFVTDFKYTGSDGAVSRDGVLKVTVGGAEASVALKNAKVGSLSLYKSFYYYVYTEASGMQSGGWWCNDTNLTAGQWTKVEFTREYAPQNTDTVSVWTADSINGFYYRFKNGSAGTVFYVTSVYGVPYPDVEVSVDQSVASYIGYEGTCKEGQTITLTCNGAPAGEAFSYFTVNNEKIEGNTYKLGTKAVVIGAHFAEVSVITLGTGVKVDGKQAENEKVTVGRGATVTLAVDYENALAGTVFDRFEVDGTPIEGFTFEADSASHNVTAVFINNVADMTWKTAEYVAPDGTIDEWGAYRKLDSANTWVLSYDITATNGDSTVNKDIPNMWYVGVLFCNNQLVGYEMGDHSVKRLLGIAGTEWGSLTGANSLADLASVFNSASESEPVTLIFARQCNAISTYIKQGGKFYCIVENKTHPAFDESHGLDFGYGWRTDCGGIPTINNIKWVTGAEKVNLFIDSIELTGKSSENQLTDISQVKSVQSITSMEYVTDKKYAGADTNVKEAGSLKVTVGGDDNGLAATCNFTVDLSNYSEVYFYVYTDVSNAQAGAYWCGDTTLVAGQWTKVSLDAALANGGPWNTDNSKIFEIGLKDMVVRLKDCTAGDVFYVTSLYGVPKENALADNKSTEYSVVSVNNELEAVVNDNFFPVAE